MQSSPTLFEDMIERIGLKDMKIDEAFYFPADTLVVEPGGRGWLNPDAQPITGKLKGNEHLIGVRRTGDGFCVGLARVEPIGYKWRSKGRPPAQNGVEWLPVVEFVRGYDPRAAAGIVPTTGTTPHDHEAEAPAESDIFSFGDEGGATPDL